MTREEVDRRSGLLRAATRGRRMTDFFASFAAEERRTQPAVMTSSALGAAFPFRWIRRSSRRMTRGRGVAVSDEERDRARDERGMGNERGGGDEEGGR